MDIEATELLILMKQLAKLGVHEGLLPVSLLLIYRRLPAVVQAAIIKRCGLTSLAFGVIGFVATSLFPELQALGSTCGIGGGMVLGAVVERLWEPLHFRLGLTETDRLERRGVITAKRAKEIRSRLVEKHFEEEEPVRVDAGPLVLRQQLPPSLQNNGSQIMPDGHKLPRSSGIN
ncbi:hypothetical protein BHS09_11200 [Myxococcus xanthus]|uniref:Uncharacterized protein n=1 Tax=Myxococcus xanthus TaxID=34 RepID=A0AAE6FYH0_MYXXA|nr:hypothetical protein [Myxococcus xanthus]QDE67504.1 hypothetical protein BHS09_11200 [Myxococcus xanthus]QDE74780.1 hypothetical protein BHS08_11215 [Myxococcus xanthus]